MTMTVNCGTFQHKRNVFIKVVKILLELMRVKFRAADLVNTKEENR